MARLLVIIDRITDGAAMLAGVLLAALFLLGAAEILARALAEATTGIALEFSGYLVAHVLLLGSGKALRDGGHIRVRLLLDRFGARAGRVLDLAATLAGLLVALLLAAALVAYAIETARLGARSYFPTATPLWLPQALLALGPVVLALSFLARLSRLLRNLEGAP